MQNKSRFEGRSGLLITIFALALVTTLAVLPTQLQWEVNSQGKGFIERTESHDEALPNFDIREAPTKVEDVLMGFRASANKNASAIADIRDGFVRGEEELRGRVPTLKVEYSQILRVPELIAPDPLKGRAVMSASTQDRVGTLRGFIKENSSLVGLPHDQLDALNVQTDFVNKVGGIGLVILEQHINDIPVFRGELAGHFSNEGELFRVTNNLASGLDYSSLSRDFGDPANAVRIAAENVGAKVDLTRNVARSTDSKVYFGDGHYPASAWKYYFQIEPGVARAAWYVNVWMPVTAYEMVIDAETGKILWRTNMGKDQTQSVTYNVWANTTSPNLSLDSPAPLTPGPIDPSLGTQGTLQPRTMVTLIGNEAPNQFNNNGWITDGQNAISGNNTHAGLDRFSPNGVDEPLITGSSNRVFNYAANPAPGNPAPGDDPVPVGTTISPCSATPQVPVDNQKASAVQMFYVVNRLHDVLYRHGFTEQTRNFQVDNFARGGTGGDPVLSEGQDCAGTNNANMASSTTDGTVARMQMFVWTGPTPDRDGTMDAEIVLHEIGHGVVNRNHINGISGTQGGQMHEGNGDFQAHLLLAESSDPINGVYTTGGYSTLNLRAAFGGAANYYWGIRRFPKAVIAFTGGPLSRPHNPLTYGDIDPAQINVGDGAFAPAFTGSATAVHDGGEIWSSMLWEVRSRFVQRLGFEAGTSKMLQLWMDSMRATTSTSSMLNSRNAMIQVAQNTGTGADVTDIWAGFASRGLGFGAQNPAGNTVIEDFGLPNANISAPITVTDLPPGGDGDGFPEPGETVQINIPVTNNTGADVTSVVVQLTGGGSANYGTVANGATVTLPIPFAISAGAPCGSSVAVVLTLTSALGSQPPTNFSFTLGSPVGVTQNFDGVTAPSLPGGWASTVSGSGTGWTTVTTTPASAPNAAFAGDPITVGISELETPATLVSSAAAALKFKLNFNTEPNFDGMVLEIKIGAGAYQDILAAGGSFVANGYNSTFPTTFENPLPLRQAWSGLSTGYVNVEATLPAAANGQNVQFKFRMGSDNSVAPAGGGVRVDDFELISSFNCGPGGPTPTPTPVPPTPTPTPVPPTPTPTPGPSSFIYDNGGLSTGPTASRGTAAPAGTTWSEVQNNTGNTTESNTLAGVGCQVTATLPANRCADDFVVPAGQTWTVDQVAVFVYQTGFAGAISPINAGTLQIWNGRPGDPGSTVIFGDTTTNRLGTSTDSLMWRIFNSSVPAPGTAPATDRRIWDTRLTVAPALALSAGTYWIDWQTRSGTTTNHFAPTITIPGVRGQAGWNARQLLPAGWGDVIDVGNPATAPDVPQDFPFKLIGDISGGSNGRADFDGDGRTDLSVFRPSEGNWYINRSTDGFLGVNWGASGDVLVPGDYDDDGTDDIAVFRADANGANPDFYILNSSNSTVTGLSWGLPGDIPAVADYDGNGVDDAAVFRPSDGTWYVLLSTGANVIVNNPGTTPVPGDYDGDGEADIIIYTNGNWTGTLSGGGAFNIALGQAGDITVPGYYDGDNIVDVAVYRPSDGTWYVRQSSDGQVVATPFGIATDIPAPGDYDGDGHDDQAIYRNGVWWINGSTSGVGVVPFGLGTDVPVPAAARP